MSYRFLLGLFLAGLLVALGVAGLQRVPGYMDAEYYYAGGLQIINGQGWQEPYLWNYLNDPQRLPAPSFAYWMPLNALLAAAGMWLAGSSSFWSARLMFILLAGLVPVLSALLAYRLDGHSGRARLAGLLALFPGFYLAYQSTTDSFPVSMVLGGLFLLVAFSGGWSWLDQRPFWLRMFTLGLLAGLMHLARADGLLWLAGAGVVGLARLVQVWQGEAPQGQGRARQTLRVALPAAVVMGLALLAGYLLVMSPWFLRNLDEWGRLLPPGGSRAMWITEYPQTMSFPASRLTPEHWLGAGAWTLLSARGEAFSNVLQTLLAVQGSIVLLPFMLAGLWARRQHPAVRLGAGMWLLIAGLMTLVFPLASINGGFFHSGAALQPLLWALAPLGIEQVGRAYAGWRKLNDPAGLVRFLQGVLLVTAVLLSGLLFYQRVVGPQPETWAWHASDQHYRAVEESLVSLGAQPGEPVLVNNPPGYWLASGRPALVVADGNEQLQLEIARRFSARYLVLETRNPLAMSDLYHGRVSSPFLEYLTNVGTTRLYRIVQAP